MTDLLGEEVFTRIMGEMHIWGGNVEHDEEVQWTTMGLEPTCVRNLCEGVLKASFGEDYPEAFGMLVGPALAYCLAFGVRLGREQGWQSES